MAHMVETMAYAGELPWHGLGFPVSNDLSVDDMQIASKTDWKVRKVPLGFMVGKKFISVAGLDKMALIRDTDNRVLSYVSKNWHEVQNDEAFDFFRTFIEAGKMEMHTAGSLDNGRVVWVLAKINDGFTINKKDDVESYLLFTNPHTYGRCLDVRFTPIRVVCNNTLTLALSGSETDSVVRLNHRQKFDAEQVKITLGLASEKMGDYGALAQFLAKRKYKKDTVRQYLQTIFPLMGKHKNDEDNRNKLSRPAELALDLVETSPGAEMAPKSWWNAFNAVTFAIDHKLGHTTDSRLRSAWFGTNRARKVLALNKAREYADAA